MTYLNKITFICGWLSVLSLALGSFLGAERGTIGFPIVIGFSVFFFLLMLAGLTAR